MQFRVTNIFFVCLLLLAFTQVQAQNISRDTINVDVAFDTARKMAFSGRRAEAESLCKRILRKSPNYWDIHTFLGRIYTWNHQYDSARAEFNQVLNAKPADED